MAQFEGGAIGAEFGKLGRQLAHFGNAVIGPQFPRFPSPTWPKAG